MDLISSMPILLNKDKTVNYNEMQTIINSINDGKGIHLFSSSLEGQTFSLTEKEEIIQNIKQMTNLDIIYETNNYIDNDEIRLINKVKPNYLIIPLFLNSKVKSKGYEKYLNEILKEVKIPTLIKLDDRFENCKINYHSIVNLIRVNKFFYGIYDKSKDNYFSNKLNYLKSIKKYASFSKYLLSDNQNSIDAVITDLNIITKKEIDQFFYEKELGFINPILNEYLLFIEECISYYPRGMAIKYLLKKNGFKGYYSKSPYYSLNGEEKDKLDFIF